MITIMTTARLPTITDVGAEHRFEKTEGVYSRRITREVRQL